MADDSHREEDNKQSDQLSNDQQQYVYCDNNPYPTDFFFFVET